MGLSILLPVLLSVVLTLIIVLIIRDFDKKSSSFNNACRKIKNYSLKISNDLAEMCNERIENVDSKCGELDISLARGEGLINKLKDNLDNFGSELESIEKVKSEFQENFYFLSAVHRCCLSILTFGFHSSSENNCLYA